MLAAGMSLLFLGQDPPTNTAPDPSLGNWFGAVAGVTWALTLMGLRWLALQPELPGASGAAAISGSVIACVVCLPMAFPVGETSAIDWGVVIYLGGVQTAMAYWLFLRGVPDLRAIEATLLLLIEPLASGVWAWLVHSETPSTISLAGCGLIFLGVVAQTLRDTDEPSR
jgi:DME family drug/metabolite transporter